MQKTDLELKSPSGRRKPGSWPVTALNIIRKHPLPRHPCTPSGRTMLYGGVVLFFLATLVAAGCTMNSLSRQKKETFQQAVRKHPNDPYAYFNLGICHYNLKAYNQALKAFKKALALDPQNGEIIYSLGVCYHQLGRFQEAMEQYRRLRFIDAKLADHLFKKLNASP